MLNPGARSCCAQPKEGVKSTELCLQPRRVDQNVFTNIYNDS